MTECLSFEDYRDFPRFKFSGNGECFLRVQIQKEKLVILCVQLLEYSGLSITNGIENIFVNIINKLLSDGSINHLITRSPWWQFWKKDDSLLQITSRTVLIEYYPPGAGLVPSGSYCLVSFVDGLEPVWNYVNKETLISQAGVNENFLLINQEKLNYEI